MSAPTFHINTKQWNSLLSRLTSAGTSDRAHSPSTESAPHSQHHQRSLASHLILPPAPQLLLTTAIHGTLLWEASSHQAKLALNRIIEYFADFNDLRVAPTLHILPILGERYPLAIERISRLHSWLNHLHHFQQSIDLEHLRDVTRKDARHFLVSLEGMPLYAADYTAMHGLGVRTIPIDERLATLLVAEEVVEAPLNASFTPAQLDSLQSQLLEATPVESLNTINTALRAWSDHDGVTPKREPNNAFAPQREFSSTSSSVAAAAHPHEPASAPAAGKDSPTSKSQSQGQSQPRPRAQPKSPAKKKPDAAKKPSKASKTSNSPVQLQSPGSDSPSSSQTPPSESPGVPQHISNDSPSDTPPPNPAIP